MYFSWIRERIGKTEEEIVLPAAVGTIGELIVWLKSRGEEYAAALQYDTLIRVAVNHEHVDDRSAQISGAREIALFPPMTGG